MHVLQMIPASQTLLPHKTCVSMNGLNVSMTGLILEFWNCFVNFPIQN